MLVAYLVAKNEADRYLQACLTSLLYKVDYAFMWDDQSDDRTVEIAKQCGVEVKVRKDSQPSFLDAEGSFRQTGWEYMASYLNLENGDWVLSIDCDEFLVGNNLSLMLRDAGKSTGVELEIPEIFMSQPLARRTDGFWGDIKGIRLAKYQTGRQDFRRSGFASGSVPVYAEYELYRPDRKTLSLLHFGYADQRDREDKYNRYNERPGHSSEHIQSILKPARLMMWDGDAPKVWRGIRG